MEKTKFTNLINSIPVIAEKDDWSPRYDKGLDYFVWAKDPVSKNSKLVKVSHEASLYVNPRGKIEGVFVEYLRDNFVEHNPSYKEFIKQFTKKVNDDVYTIGSKKNAEKYLFAFGEALRADVYQDIENRGKKLDLDKLVNFALSQ